MRIKTMLCVCIVGVLYSGPVQAAEERITVDLSTWTSAERDLFYMAAYKVYRVKSGASAASTLDINGNETFIANRETGEIVVQNPVQPLTDVIKPVWLKRAVDATINYRNADFAQQQLDRIEERQLYEEVKAGLRNWSTMSEPVQRTLENKQKRLELLQMGAHGTEVVYVEPDLVTP